MRGHSHQTIYRPAMRLSWGMSRNSRRFPRFRGQRVYPWQHFLKYCMFLPGNSQGYLFLFPGSSELRVFSLGTFYVQVHGHVHVFGRHLSRSLPPLFLTCWRRLVFILLPTAPFWLFLVHLAQAPCIRLLPFHLWSLLRLTTSQRLWFSPFCFLFSRLQINSCFWFWKIFGNVSWSKLLCQHFSFNTMHPLMCAQSCSCLKVPCFRWWKAIFTMHLELQVCSTQMTEGSHFFHVYTVH